MFNETKIEKMVGIKEFIEFIEEHKEEQIECTPHTFFRLVKGKEEFLLVPSSKEF